MQSLINLIVLLVLQIKKESKISLADAINDKIKFKSELSEKKNNKKNKQIK